MEAIRERYELAKERIIQIENENRMDKSMSVIFRRWRFLHQMTDTYEYVEDGRLSGITGRTAENERELYEDVVPEHYEESYANPAYAVGQFGEEYGRLLCFLYTELRSLIVFAFENQMEMTIRMELFLKYTVPLFVHGIM